MSINSPHHRASPSCMADPDVDHGLAYTNDGTLDLDRSPFFDPEFGGDTTVDCYLERVQFLLTEAIEERLGINYWYQELHPETLHPVCRALQRGLTYRTIESSELVVPADIHPGSSADSLKVAKYL